MSDYKESANKRRDIRNLKEPEDLTGSPKLAPKKKNTKRWCRGKVGIEHQLECRNYASTKHNQSVATKQLAIGIRASNNWRILVCKICGKELETWYGKQRNKPDWVTC